MAGETVLYGRQQIRLSSRCTCELYAEGSLNMINMN